LKHKQLVMQFVKFGIVGVINTVLSYLITNGCYYALSLHEQISNIIAFLIAFVKQFLYV
jgi:putative flippase GtrA